MGIAGLGLWELGWFLVQRREREILYERATKAARKRGKPLLVVGDPYGQYGCGQEGDVVLDVRTDATCPNQVRASTESIPYEDKRFGAVLASHTLEHVCEPGRALAELKRVADEVFIASPYWWRLSTFLVPRHAWWITGISPNPHFHRLHGSCNLIGRVGEKRESYAIPSTLGLHPHRNGG